jgi:hypothetical protein
MPSTRPLLLCLVFALLAVSPASLGADSSEDRRPEGLPEYQAGDPDAAVVTESNLVESERFWPYQVALARSWQPAGGARPLSPGILGVLIRVEASGAALIDFGRDGRHEVPVGATDLVERANRIRQGELHKMAPNFVLAIGPRLLDSESAEPRTFGVLETSRRRIFLAVFADPGAEDFPDLAAALAPLRERDGLLTILFPQGEHPDSRVRERLRTLGWTIPFVYDHLSEPYSRSLLAEGVPLPALMLQTGEGRLLFQGGWSARAVRELRSALDAAPSGTPAPGAAVDEGSV